MTWCGISRYHHYCSPHDVSFNSDPRNLWKTLRNLTTKNRQSHSMISQWHPSRNGVQIASTLNSLSNSLHMVAKWEMRVILRKYENATADSNITFKHEKVVKKLGYKGISFLSTMNNISMKDWINPINWKTPRIIPLFKPG